MELRSRFSRPHIKPKAYAIDHARTLVFTLGQLYRSPLASLLTTVVIGIALALPSGLFVLLKNSQVMTEGWQHTARISLFLKPGSSVETLKRLAAELAARDDIAEVRQITAEAALREFRAQSGFGQALDALEKNPLPHVLVLIPANAETAAVGALLEQLSKLPEVDMAQFDMEWLQRLVALIDLLRRGIVILALMLAATVLLIVGNTIRLDIQNRRQEIEVIKLVGATDAFVRRPFLYGGLWYGIIGGIIAWLIVFVALRSIDGPARQLAGLYGSQFTALGLDASDTLVLFAISSGLGLIGSWLAVGQHLNDIDPQ